MELGEKLKEARIAAGLSQRQLCGEEITRNMLSQIEHGTARPSMSTLKYLASRLQLPVSYFLGEETLVPANVQIMQQAWEQLESGNFAECFRLLETVKDPEPACIREYRILKVLSLLNLAQKCISEGKDIYARQLLAEAAQTESCLPWLPDLKARRLELAAQMDSIPEEAFPSLDNSLLIHAQLALRAGKAERAIHLLDAMVNQESSKWQFLRGRAAAERKDYTEAIPFLQNAEKYYPKESIPLLEICYRELGDFRMAYQYACKGR